ncbi:MAG: PorT family protein [Bacteroidetes bacterium]|nr:PorT family protein [Bacteroidota bacterium]
MKQIVFSTLLFLAAISVNAQPTFDVGIKAGINISKMSFDIDNYSSESILKSHVGAFGRVGWGRVFVQPEAYFSAKGGDLSAGIIQTATSFNYSTVDVPILFGVKLIKGDAFDFHAVAGPVFSFLTSKSIEGDKLLTKEYYEDNYIGFQYGVGVDILFVTVDARMEHGSNNLYQAPSFDGKNQTFMVSVGFKIF